MKKLAFIFTIVSVVFSVSSFAQSSTGTSKYIATLGNIKPSFEGGKMVAVTKAQLLANTQVSVPVDDCQVVGFKFSILPKDGDFTGPFAASGSELSDKMKSLINENAGPGKSGKIFIEEVSTYCGGNELKAAPIILSYAD